MQYTTIINIIINIIFYILCFFNLEEIGSAFQLTHGLMELFSGYTYDFKKLSEILGLYFQIRDDYCNLCMKEVR